jgi:hypothetical protein
VPPMPPMPPTPAPLVPKMEAPPDDSSQEMHG